MQPNFLSHNYYQEVRTLICNERIKLANIYLRFGSVDCRFLLAGSANSKWSVINEQFQVERTIFDSFLTEQLVQKEVRVADSSNLVEVVKRMTKEEELVLVQQGDSINGNLLLTEICLFKNYNSDLVFSELREGREGFDFVLEEQELKRRFEFAERKSVFVVNNKNLKSLDSNIQPFKRYLLGLHNESLSIDFEFVAKAMRDLIMERNKNVNNYVSNLDNLPTFFALKYCGPICWYFNRIVQSVYGLNKKFSCFTDQQLNLAQVISNQSQVCRNIGLMVGKADSSKKIFVRLQNGIEKLITMTSDLSKLRC